MQFEYCKTQFCKGHMIHRKYNVQAFPQIQIHETRILSFKNFKSCYLIFSRKQPTLLVTFFKRLNFNKNFSLEMKIKQNFIFGGGIRRKFFLARFRLRSEYYMSNKCLLHYWFEIQGQMHVRQKSLFFIKYVKCHIENAIQRR